MYDELLQEIEEENLEVISAPLAGELKGLYIDDLIVINSGIETTVEKVCILAEELGHYYTSVGDILDLSKVENRQQENRARRWAVKRLISLDDFIRAFDNGVRNSHELAEFLGITEEFLQIALDHFRRYHGYSCSRGDYLICFDPLWISKKIE